MTAIPLARQGRLRRLRKDFFGSTASTMMTLASVAVILALLRWVLNWAVLNATFSASATQAVCAERSGACWAVIAARWRVILFGIYPYEEQWRSALACAVVVVVIVLSCLPRFWSFGRLALTWGFGAAIFYILMRGGVLGLVRVNEQQWGGLPLTLFIFVATGVIGMPLAIVLALMRRSELPVVARVTGWIIDTIRSLPLLSILFTCAIVLPFMLPGFLVGEKLYRVVFGIALFFAAYQAEIIRGGFQGVPRGQEEAAKALGLPYWPRMARIVLPQAFRLALPATINQFVIAFMETSLVVVVGFVELLAAGNTAYHTGEWKFAYIEVYAFVAAIYFAFVFGLSRYGAYLEARMSAGQRKE
ncbi:MAG: amino acid ABC transporter permease [Gemmobacter sp.]|jgi:general L-amino acid transport system permease protein|nr:amino acid ABC transporter permease [Gemmobacter sp.]